MTCVSCGLERDELSEKGLCTSCKNAQKLLAVGREQAQQQFDKVFASAGTDPESEPDDDDTDLAAVYDLDTSSVSVTTAYMWPNEYFEKAAPGVADDIIALVESEDIGEVQIDTLLVRLAYTPGDTAAKAFARWDAEQPNWVKNLWMPVPNFTIEAGWELIDGAKRVLTFPFSVPLRYRTSGDVVVGPGTAGEACTHCGTALFTALDINADDQRFRGIGLTGRVRIVACPACIQLSVARDDDDALASIVRFAPDGSSALEVRGSETMEFDGEVLAAWEIDPDAIPSRWRAGTWEAQVPVIGGLPAWEQDAEYAACPDCAETMRHLASLPLYPVTGDGVWGTANIQVCTDDSVARLVFQTS